METDEAGKCAAGEGDICYCSEVLGITARGTPSYDVSSSRRHALHIAHIPTVRGPHRPWLHLLYTTLTSSTQVRIIGVTHLHLQQLAGYGQVCLSSTADWEKKSVCCRWGRSRVIGSRMSGRLGRHMWISLTRVGGPRPDLYYSRCLATGFSRRPSSPHLGSTGGVP